MARAWLSLWMFQSTPSVSRGRCGVIDLGPACRRCFNPRPPFPEGDAANRKQWRTRQHVSIHALRFQRAMPARGQRYAWLCVFQSTPSVSRGRCAVGSVAALAHASFNPRPPFPEGDARISGVMPNSFSVSIHALRFQRAMHRGRQRQEWRRAVSIHALRFQRAMRQKGAKQRGLDQFQSTPSVSRGRCA